MAASPNTKPTATTIPLGDRPAPTTNARSNTVPNARAFTAGDMTKKRWRIIRLLGTNGMGEVYEAEDLELHERVTLKALPSRLAGDAEALARLRREVQLARKVTHPNVCRIFDLG